ncbi:MAG: (Fe-S)-binding protein [Methylobacter sp.]
MAYGQAFDQARMQLGIVPNRLAKLALWLIENKRWLKRMMPWLALYLKTGVRGLLRKSGLLDKLQLAAAEALLTHPDLSPLATHYPVKTARRGRVALFTGCLTETFDRETLTSAIGLLNAIGYEVLVPEQQNCCGAIHRHNGQPAGSLINRNIEAFNALDVEAVVFTASGCGSMLKEYTSPGNDQAEKFCIRLHDIHEFLISQWPDDLQLKPADWKVTVQEPCRQRNVLKNQQAVYSLLEKIPGITAVPLADNHLCCGAGGAIC